MVYGSAQQLGRVHTYSFPWLCPIFPLADAERARRHDSSRVFFKGAIILLGRPVKRWPAASAVTRCRSSSLQPPRPPHVDGSAADCDCLVRELVNRDHWPRGKKCRVTHATAAASPSSANGGTGPGSAAPRPPSKTRQGNWPPELEQ
jgi:hypothetical protein